MTMADHSPSSKYTGLDEIFNEKKPIKVRSYPAAQEYHELCDKRLSYIQRFPKRYIVGIMAFFGFCIILASVSNVYALRANLSVAIVAMTANKTVTENGSTKQITQEFDWTTSEEGLILSSFFYGYIISQLPGGYLANRIGGKYLFGGGILVTAVLTLITPLCARWNVYLLVALRILEGLFEGVTYPSIHAIWSKWAPPQEKTKLATLAFSGSYFGTVIAMPVSGALANSTLGWPSIFYVFGTIGVIWFLCWCILVYESPAKHPTIRNSELEYIQSNIGYTDEQTQNMMPPWLDILRSPAVWAVVMAHFAENWGFYTWLTELPSFMRYALHYKIYNAGFLAAVPYLIMGIVVMTSGHLADLLRERFKISTTLVRKAFTCGAFGCQIIFMIAAGYIMTKTAAVICLTIAVGLGGFAWAGFSVNHLDIAPQYASILMGLSNTFATIPGIVSPLITGEIVTNKADTGQWQIVFYIASGIYLLGALIFGVFASGNRQKWAEVPTGYLSQMDIDGADIDRDDL
ncbi:hypothetical protein KUTeg_006426 [Tegillarca granosa]|uniref:Major facilitator superfamily (MFS) profile domain-containing protein n=1 Tax=Tegillarca granosa TaxID=220873 RepID=A0ABQ9FIN2_TEGGR|nr:hypothetical protein KUTeg_006426 [Tegillarca granosa]